MSSGDVVVRNSCVRCLIQNRPTRINVKTANTTNVQNKLGAKRFENELVLDGEFFMFTRKGCYLNCGSIRSETFFHRNTATVDRLRPSRPCSQLFRTDIVNCQKALVPNLLICWPDMQPHLLQKLPLQSIQRRKKTEYARKHLRPACPPVSHLQH